ncbi:hypothetical protein GPECTOR_20g584 [Gonium pectorale]|uniref:Uncharacterized protein n=1 Tax=Gonium pectorale TaxID=33097 RepID=A0A150GIU9_GONPE|nr:hypothetical protein GPECTOR_20g584 [Gonium pectorale]|eukprot:KXZ49727.1 hypothetical protein GPECTOR_20g584 [Gonium pectorale]
MCYLPAPTLFAYVSSGMIVPKLERERPACATHGNVLYYVKDRFLRTYDFATQRDNPLMSICRAGNAGANQNPAENALLITSDVDSGSYELYSIPKETARGDSAGKPNLRLASLM